MESTKKRRPPQFRHLPKEKGMLPSSFYYPLVVIHRLFSKETEVVMESASKRDNTAVLKEDSGQHSEHNESIDGASDLESSDKHDKPVDRNSGSEKLLLRDLTKKAYAPSSLHNLKSDPLHKRRGRYLDQASRQGREGKERGQPNMKMRMDAMLERIKQNLHDGSGS